jgi:hypothetical protein
MTSGLGPPGTFISSPKLHMCSMQYDQRLLDLIKFDLNVHHKQKVTHFKSQILFYKKSLRRIF